MLVDILLIPKSEKLKMWNSFCVAYTKYKPRNVMIQDVYSSWICHGEQSACHVVYYRRGYIPVCAWLTYVSFKASESGHFIFMGVTRCRRSFFLSSYSFIFVALTSHAGFPTVGLSSKCGLQREVVLSQANISRSPTFHGLDLWCRLRLIET